MRLRQCVFVCKDLEGSSEELCDILGIEVAYRDPGVEAPAWQLWPVAVLANPVFLAALVFMALDWECVVGRQRGWCLVAAMAIIAAGLCLLPPLGGLLWRSWKRHRARPR